MGQARKLALHCWGEDVLVCVCVCGRLWSWPRAAHQPGPELHCMTYVELGFLLIATLSFALIR